MTPKISKLTHEELDRYARQIALPEIGKKGQERLKRSKVLVVGAGGLGSPVLLYLTAAGVGRIGLADADIIQVSNLQRQVLYDTRDNGRSKVERARERLSGLNPNVDWCVYDLRLEAGNIMEIIQDYDLVVDGTDNFLSRYVLNDACVLSKKPYVYGSVLRFTGQASVFGAKGGPCYRCLFPKPPQNEMNCVQAGVMGVVPGLIGLIQATEVIKLLTGQGDTLAGRLLVVDTLSMTFSTLRVRPDPGCPVCGRKPTIRAPRAETIQCGEAGPDEITARQLKAMLDKGQKSTLVDVRTPEEYDRCRIEGSILIPLDTLERSLRRIPRDLTVVLYCHHEMRSRRAL
jgi:adenylyltransferase/sulfurtransferase